MGEGCCGLKWTRLLASNNFPEPFAAPATTTEPSEHCRYPEPRSSRSLKLAEDPISFCWGTKGYNKQQQNEQQTTTDNKQHTSIQQTIAIISRNSTNAIRMPTKTMVLCPAIRMPTKTMFLWTQDHSFCWHSYCVGGASLIGLCVSIVCQNAARSMTIYRIY